MSFKEVAGFLAHEGRGMLLIAEGAIVGTGLVLYSVYLYFGGRAGLGKDAANKDSDHSKKK